MATPKFGDTAGAMVVLDSCVVSQGDTGIFTSKLYKHRTEHDMIGPSISLPSFGDAADSSLAIGVRRAMYNVGIRVYRPGRDALAVPGSQEHYLTLTLWHI